MVVCSKEVEDKSESLFVSKFHLYKRPVVLDVEKSLYQKYLKHHFIAQANQHAELGGIRASQVDIERFVTQRHT